jgi:hypothetical protein
MKELLTTDQLKWLAGNREAVYEFLDVFAEEYTTGLWAKAEEHYMCHVSVAVNTRRAIVAMLFEVFKVAGGETRYDEDPASGWIGCFSRRLRLEEDLTITLQHAQRNEIRMIMLSFLINVMEEL